MLLYPTDQLGAVARQHGRDHLGRGAGLVAAAAAERGGRGESTGRRVGQQAHCPLLRPQVRAEVSFRVGHVGQVGPGIAVDQVGPSVLLN